MYNFSLNIFILQVQAIQYFLYIINLNKYIKDFSTTNKISVLFINKIYTYNNRLTNKSFYNKFYNQ